jgi:hypothetical protein
MPSSNSPEDFGRDIWRTLRGGQRVLLGTVRTVRPYPAEEGNQKAFEARMNLMADRLLEDPVVDSVDTDYERKHGRVVLCTITVRYVAESAPETARAAFGAFGLAAA